MHGRLNELQHQRTVEHRLVRQLSEHTLTGLLAAPPPLAAPPLRCGLLADMKEEERNRVQRRTEEQMQRENEKHGIRSPLTAAVLGTRSGCNAYSSGEDVAGSSCKISTMLDRYRWRTYMHGPTQVRLASSCSGNCTGVANCELVDNKIRITYCTSTTGLGFVHITTIIIGSLLTSKSLFNSSQTCATIKWAYAYRFAGCTTSPGGPATTLRPAGRHEGRRKK